MSYVESKISRNPSYDNKKKIFHSVTEARRPVKSEVVGSSPTGRDFGVLLLYFFYKNLKKYIY
jgi:hypothetical protein